MSPFELCQVANREELDQIVLVVWAAMENTDPSHSVFYPILTDGPESRNEAIKATQERIWQEHVSDPHSHWLYVRETKGVEMGTGKVVGGCQWRIYKENPFKGGIPEVNAHWWPEGESRAFASEVIRQLFNPRAIWMGRPHVGLSLMCVHPSHQRHGAGSLLMSWGIDQADSLGLESFVEATPMGKFLYEAHGYKSIKEVSVLRKEGASIEWKVLEEKLLPIGYTAMWRPVNGVWDDSEQDRTWRERMGVGES